MALRKTLNRDTDLFSGMKKMMMVLCCICLAGCSSASASAVQETPDPVLAQAQEILSSMRLEDKLEQMMVISVETWNGNDFTDMNEEASRLFSDYHFGGITLFAQNLADFEQTSALITDMNTLNTGTPYMIATDQEGGYVTRLSFGTDTPGNMALCASGNPDNAEKAASIIAEELSAIGINTDFAPDTDVNSNPSNPVIGIRSFSDDPDLVSVFSEAYRKGLEEHNVGSCLKHFPGHGNTDTDSHTGLPSVNETYEQLQETDLKPFIENIQDGADLIMTAHIQYPQIIEETARTVNGEEITLPASLSKHMITDILRGDLGYDGLVITDSLRMDAISADFTIEDACRLAILAGDDLLLMPVTCNDSSCYEQLDALLASLTKDVNDKVISEERVDESVLRILEYKIRHGYFKVEEKQSVDFEAMQKAHEAESRIIAQDCVTVVKNDDVFPLDKEDSVLFLGVNERQANALKYAYRQQADQDNAVFVNHDWGKAEGMESQLEGMDVLVMTSWYDDISQLDPEQSVMIPAIQDMITKAHEQNMKVIVISTALPYDLGLYEEADALLAVYNPTGISFDKDGWVYGLAGENIPAAVDVLYGAAEGKGSLPVNVPKAEGTAFSNEIVYARGFCVQN